MFAMDPGLIFFAWMLFVPVAYSVGVILHELAHAIVAAAVGFKVYGIRLGWGSLTKRWRMLGVDVSLCGYPNGGLVFMCPRIARGYHWKTFLVLAAGPLVNVALIAVFVKVFDATKISGLPLPSFMLFVSTVMIPANFLICLQTLIPHASKHGGQLFPSDALSMIRLFGKRHAEISGSIDIGNAMQAARMTSHGEADTAFRWLRRKLSRSQTSSPEYLGAAVHWLAQFGAVEESRSLIHLLLRYADEPTLSPDDRRELVDSLSTWVLQSPSQELVKQCFSVVDEMVATHPDRITLRGTRGGLLFELGELDAAVQDLRRCMKDSSAPIDRGISAAYLAVISEMRGASVEATEFESIARESGATHPLIDQLIQRFQLLVLRGTTAHLSRSTPLTNLAAKQLEVAQLLFTRGKREASVRWLCRSLRNPKLISEIPYLQFVVSMASNYGGVKVVADAYRKIRERTERSNPEMWRDASDGLGSFALYGRHEDLLPEALAVMSEAILKFPESITLYGTRGGIHFDMGNIEEAMADLKRCNEMSSSPFDRGLSAAFLAAIASKAGAAEAAKTYAKSARQQAGYHGLVSRVLASMAPRDTSEPTPA